MMTGRIAILSLLGMAVAAAPAARAQDAWQQPEHLRGFVARGFASDGTPPAASKGPKPKPATAPVAAANAEKPRREADLTPAPATAVQPVVQPVVHLSPMARLTSLPWPKMPHGFQDPTHPVGPAEPGSAAKPRFGPVSSGFTLPRR